MDPDAEVQGEICLAVQVLEGARGRCLHCHVLKARYGPAAAGGSRGRSEAERGSPGSPQLPWPLVTSSLLGLFGAYNQNLMLANSSSSLDCKFLGSKHT